MSDPTLLVMSGSLRRGSFNRKLMHEAARLFGTKPVVADLGLPLYDGDAEAAGGVPAAVRALAGQIAGADAVVIATPEYNQSFSGVLKNALDWVSRAGGAPWKDKPVAIVSATAGRAGGARAQYALRLALNPFQPRLLTGPEVMVGGAADHFDDDGRLKEGRSLTALEALMVRLRAEAGRR